MTADRQFAAVGGLSSAVFSRLRYNRFHLKSHWLALADSLGLGFG